MSEYTVSVALAAAVRVRPALSASVWRALLRRVAATAADMHDDGARETFRMLSHLEPPFQVKAAPRSHPPRAPADPYTSGSHGVNAPQKTFNACRAPAEPGADVADACGTGSTGGQTHATPDAAAWSMHGNAGGDEQAVAVEHVPLSPVQDTFDAFFGGSAEVQATAEVHGLDVWAHTALQCAVQQDGGWHAVRGSRAPNGEGGEADSRRKRHGRVWVPEGLQRDVWSAARAAVERRLQLTRRDARLLRLQLLRESARDLQLNVWARQRREALVGAAAMPVHII